MRLLSHQTGHRNKNAAFRIHFQRYSLIGKTEKGVVFSTERCVRLWMKISWMRTKERGKDNLTNSLPHLSVVQWLDLCLTVCGSHLKWPHVFSETSAFIISVTSVWQRSRDLRSLSTSEILCYRKLEKPCCYSDTSMISTWARGV